MIPKLFQMGYFGHPGTTGQRLALRDLGHFKISQGKSTYGSEPIESICREEQVEHKLKVGDMVYLHLHPQK